MKTRRRKFGTVLNYIYLESVFFNRKVASGAVGFRLRRAVRVNAHSVFLTKRKLK